MRQWNLLMHHGKACCEEFPANVPQRWQLVLQLLSFVDDGESTVLEHLPPHSIRCMVQAFVINELQHGLFSFKFTPARNWFSIITMYTSVSFLYRWRRPDLLYAHWMSALMRGKDHCIINTVVKLCNLQRMTRLLSPAVSNGITSSPQSQCRYILQWKAPGLAVLDELLSVLHCIALQEGLTMVFHKVVSCYSRQVNSCLNRSSTEHWRQSSR